MSKRFLPAALAFCAAIACAQSLAPAQSTNAPKPPTQGTTNPPAREGKTAEVPPKPDAASPQPDPTKPAFQVTQLDEAGLSKLLGLGPAPDAPSERRPLLVNFWATWCDPCREEMPDLVKIDDEFRPRGLDFALVSLDDAEEISKGVPDFLRLMRATRIPSYLLNANDPEAAIVSVDPNWRGELPATFLFDRTGRLAFKHVGRIKPAELRKAVEAALDAGTRATGRQ